MKIHPRDFRVAGGTKVSLAKWPTCIAPSYQSHEDYQAILARHVHELSTLQTLLYAHDRYSLLLVFQGMDAAGKDTAIKHVMSGVNPQGCQVYSFKQPSAEEQDHDFLWRTTRVLPERGRIGIFNRSYYEEVLVTRVHPAVLHAEHLPEEEFRKKEFWEHRYESINGLERHLHRNGTRVVKFFLHVSKEEQAARLLRRLDDPKRNWKFSAADLAERSLWKEYTRAFEQCIAATSTSRAPWYIVPADDKENARLIVSRIILDTLKRLRMKYPALSASKRKELLALRTRLTH